MARTAAATASSASATTARACARAASSASTRTRRAARSYPSVASDASGNFVVVWESYGQDGSDYGIFGQRYDSAGVRSGSEFRVNSYTTSRQRLPSVAADASGNFVVVWDSYGQDGSDAGSSASATTARACAQGSEFRVNSYTTGDAAVPLRRLRRERELRRRLGELGQDGSGDGIFGQRYDSAGVAQGSEFRVNSYTTSGQRCPSVASDASGNFVVVWESYGQDGSGYGIFGQRYDSAGVAQGSEFRVNSYTTGAPAVSLRRLRRERELRRRLAQRSARTAAATGSSASATTARAWLRGASSRSTPSRPAISGSPLWGLRVPTSSSWPGTPTARTEAATASSASASTSPPTPRRQTQP